MRNIFNVIIITAFSFFVLSDSANATWREVGSEKLRVLFQPPYMENRSPVKFVQELIGSSAQSDWLCWGEFSHTRANACVTYQTSSRGFDRSITRVTDIFRRFSDFKKVSHTKDGDVWKAESQIGGVSLIRFHVVNNNLSRKNCVAFAVDFPRRKKLLNGWYCAPNNVVLETVIIEKMVSTIGIKGKSKPEYVTYPPVTQVLSVSQKNAEIAADALCRFALSSDGTQWDLRPALSDKVDAAKNRGLTPEKCVELLKP